MTALWLVPTVLLVVAEADGQGGIAIIVVGVLACAVHCLAFGLVRGVLGSRDRWRNGWTLTLGVLVLCLCVRAVSVVRATHLLRVASSLEADAHVLSSLYDERDAWFGEGLVRRLAANRNAPEPLLRKLFAHGGEDVYYALASNPSTPADVLRDLRGRGELVDGALGRNPAVE